MVTKESQLDIEHMTMAVREEIMQYFKGTCVSKVTENQNIEMLPISLPSQPAYHYQRQAAARKSGMLLFIGKAPILQLEKSPPIITFQTGVLGRSKQLRELHKQLEIFMKKYLPAVQRSHNYASIIT